MSLFRQPQPADPTRTAVCGCGHHLALHDRDERMCGYLKVIYNDVEEVVRDTEGNPVLDRHGDIQTIRNHMYAHTTGCGCRQYVGPEVINPLTSNSLVIPQR
ncbi:hypothetical protein [Nocardia sp. NPDC004722]